MSSVTDLCRTGNYCIEIVLSKVARLPSSWTLDLAFYAAVREEFQQFAGLESPEELVLTSQDV